MSSSTVEIMNKGMQCLLENLGVVEAEQFVSVIIKEQFDYTKWQREYFDNMSPEEIDVAVKQYVERHAFEGKAKTVI
jgi:hypothetical protein